MKASIDKVDPRTDYTKATLGKKIDDLPGLIITCLPFNWLKGGSCSHTVGSIGSARTICVGARAGPFAEHHHRRV
jgi:hypothetical protein